MKYLSKLSGAIYESLSKEIIKSQCYEVKSPLAEIAENRKLTRKRATLNDFLAQEELAKSESERSESEANSPSQTADFLKQAYDAFANGTDEGEYIDDTTAEELENGFKATFAFIKDEPELAKDWFELYKSETDEANILKIAKWAKKEEIKGKKEEALKAGVSFRELTFNATQDDLTLLMAAATNFTENLEWIAKENTSLSLDEASLKELAAMIANKISNETLKARELKDRAEAAANEAELEAIKWE